MNAMTHQTFPKGALIAVGALMLLTVGGAGAVRIAHLSTPAAPPAPPPAVAAIELRFGDRSDGAITVDDARSGAPVSVVAPGSGGFVRGVMRGMARDRMSRHIGRAAPFRLSQDREGRLWLQDTATLRLIDLEAFGEGNRAAFEAFLPSANTSGQRGRA